MPLALVEQGGGGGGGAPGSFKVIGQRPDILVRSQTDVVDAMTLTVQENIYGVLFSFTIPRTEWAADGSQYWGALYSSWVQEIGSKAEVVGMTYTQDVNAAGLLRDEMVITLGTPDGANTTEVTWPLATLNSGGVFGAINDAYATLTATAGIT